MVGRAMGRTMADRAAANRTHQAKIWRGVDRARLSRQAARELADALAASYGSAWRVIDKRVAVLDCMLAQPDERFGPAQDFIRKILACVE